MNNSIKPLVDKSTETSMENAISKCVAEIKSCQAAVSGCDVERARINGIEKGEFERRHY